MVRAEQITAAPTAPAGNIYSDLENGEEPYLFGDLRRQPFMPRPRGKTLETYVLARWATRGLRGVVLESVRAGTGRASTRSSVLRFFSRLSGDQPAAARSNARRERAINRAEQELAATGL